MCISHGLEHRRNVVLLHHHYNCWHVFRQLQQTMLFENAASMFARSVVERLCIHFFWLNNAMSRAAQRCFKNKQRHICRR